MCKKLAFNHVLGCIAQVGRTIHALYSVIISPVLVKLVSRTLWEISLGSTFRRYRFNFGGALQYRRIWPNYRLITTFWPRYDHFITHTEIQFSSQKFAKKSWDQECNHKITVLLTIPGLALVTGFLRNLPRQIAEPATQHKPREKQENLSCFLTHKLPFLLERYRLLQLKTMLAQSESSFSEILGSFSYSLNLPFLILS